MSIYGDTAKRSISRQFDKYFAGVIKMVDVQSLTEQIRILVNQISVLVIMGLIGFIAGKTRYLPDIGISAFKNGNKAYGTAPDFYDPGGTKFY